MSWELNQYPGDLQLVEALAADIARNLQAAVASRDRASVAVSGGRTPMALFERLSHCDIEWNKVTVTLVDERWVPEQHPDSNAGLVKTRLLKGRASHARFVGLKTAEADPFAAATQLDRVLGSLMLPLDVVVLGMGDDGHTASFFQGARGVEQALDPQTGRLCCAVETDTAPHPRMTLTLPVIVSARQIYLHVVGSGKMRVLDQALASAGSGGDAADAGELPITTVLRRATGPVQIYYAEQGAKL